MYYVKLRDELKSARFEAGEPVLVLDHHTSSDGNFQLVVVDKNGAIGAVDSDRFTYLGRNKAEATGKK